MLRHGLAERRRHKSTSRGLYSRVTSPGVLLHASNEPAPSTPTPFVLFTVAVTSDDACGRAMGRGYESGLEAVFGSVVVIV